MCLPMKSFYVMAEQTKLAMEIVTSKASLIAKGI